MDLDPPLAIGEARRPPAPAIDPDLLPTRRLALTALRSALASGRGPAAITGEPGVGKSALRRSLEAGRRPGEDWAVVEAGPGTTPRLLYRLLARALDADPAGFDRPALLDALAGRAFDGGRVALVVDEAQNLDNDALEEVRVLSNRLGELDGFAAILLVGQSPLARRLMSRAGAALASRLAAHVHLRPLDPDEVGRLLRVLDPGRAWPEALVDRVHLATAGRPGRVVDWLSGPGARPSLPAAPDEPEPIALETPARDAPLVGPERPPIRVEDGLIEVGWSPEAESPSSTPSDPEVDGPAPSEEPINDHYAALQAWHEWATNQGRHPEPVAEDSTTPADDGPPSPLASSPTVWADEEHGFAPFGRLFARLPQENEAD